MKHAFVALGGLVFGFGLALSGMAKPEVVLAFLHLDDLGLVLVMGGAVVATVTAFQLGPRLMERPLVGTFSTRTSTLSPRMLVGAALFGIGWGVSGMCPGAAIASVGLGNTAALFGVVAMFLGGFVEGRFLRGPKS